MKRLVAWGDEVQGPEILDRVLEAGARDVEFISRGGRSLLVLAHDEGAEAILRRLGLSYRVEEGAARWELVALGGSGALLGHLGEAKIRRARRRNRVLRLGVEGAIDLRRQTLLELARDEGFDLAILPEGEFPRAWRLVVLDMDSTLITIEVVDELARACGRYEEVAKITERAMRGELDFEQSLRARVALLAGERVEVLMRLAENLPLSPGAERLVAGLKTLGLRVAVLSGGFTPGVQALQERLGLDHAHANHLEVREGKLTGGLVGPIVDAARKAALLEEIARAEGAELRQVVAVGDGANDRLMLEKAGLGVAYRAKPALREVADAVVERGGLDSILYFLGLDEQEVDELVQG